MSHPRDLLEREGERFQLPQPAMDRLVGRRDRKRRRQRVAALVVAVAIAMAGAGALLRAFPPNQLIPAVDPSHWSPVPLAAAQSGETQLRAVAVAGGTYVAVGDVSTGSKDGSSSSPVWTSPDGLHWAPVPRDSLPNIDNLWDVTAGGVGFVSTGSRGDIWYSSDGTQWSQAEVPSPRAGHFEFYRIVSAGGRIFALGNVDGDAAILSSPDGVHWSLPANLAALGGADEQAIQDVAAVGSGFVAVGSEFPHDRSSWKAAVWTSPDGTTWTRQQDSPTFSQGDPAMTTIVQTPSGIAVQGCAGVQEPWRGEVWTSTDGRTWSRAAPQSSLEGACINAVADVGGAFIATGNTWDGKTDEAGVVWTSPDAVTWTRVDTGTTYTPVRHGDVWLDDMVLGPDGLIAVGMIQSVAADQTLQRDAGVWTTMPVPSATPTSASSEPPSPAGDVGAVVATGDATTLRTGDRLDLDGPAAPIAGEQGGVDLRWTGTHIEPSTTYPPGPTFVQPLPGGSFDQLTADGLAALEWARPEYDPESGVNPVAAGQNFAAWTNGGNLAKVQVLEAGDTVTIRWVTYRWTAPACENTQTTPPFVDANGDPVIASSGSLVLCGTHVLDLDHGLQEGSETLAGVDLWFEQGPELNTGTSMGYGGADLADLGQADFDGLTLDSLRGADYSTARIPGSELIPGEVVAVRTDDGNYAKVQILTDGYDLRIRFVTYQG